VLADALADLANRSLDLDPASRARLSALEGRQLQISTDLPPPLGRRDFALTVNAGRLRFFPHAPPQPNVIVRGPPPDLAAWLIAGESAASTRVSIEGDATVLSELSAAFRAFRPDIGNPLSRLLGPEFAQTALGAAELAFATLRSALEGASQTARDSAARAFVDRPLAEQFFDELDDLRLRVDRLAARLQAQEQSRAAP
jgi:ubiquinone biosynthesis protein UbiJ